MAENNLSLWDEWSHYPYDEPHLEDECLIILRVLCGALHVVNLLEIFFQQLIHNLGERRHQSILCHLGISQYNSGSTDPFIFAWCKWSHLRYDVGGLELCQ